MSDRKTGFVLILLVLLLALVAGAGAEGEVDYGGRTLPTPIPPVEATPEPEIPALQPGENTGAIRVRVFNDKNRNAEQGFAEEGVAGVRVCVIGEDDTLVYSGMTDTQGETLAEGLPEGSYRLRIFVAEDWGFTDKCDAEGLEYSCIADTLEASADSDPIPVSAGQQVYRGVGVCRTLHVSGTCWMDVSGDGVWQDEEPRIPAVHITLEGQKNGLFYETWSREDGTWQIDRVRPAFYTITAYSPDGMMFARYSKTGGNRRSIFSGDGDTKGFRTIDTN